jgi:hypothetical protein
MVMRNVIPLLITVASTIYADTVTTLPITSGSFFFSGKSGGFGISGPGFSFGGGGATTSEFPCSSIFDFCPAGTQIFFNAVVSSEDRGVSGTITVGSASRGYVENPATAGFAEMDAFFNLTAPAISPSSTLTLTGPCTGEAIFSDPNFPAPFTTIENEQTFIFTGQGVVTATLLYPNLGTLFPTTYVVEGLQFDFGNAGTATPEPSTSGLVFAAVAAFLVRKRFSKMNHATFFPPG